MAGDGRRTAAVAWWISVIFHPFVTVSVFALAAGVRSVLFAALFATVPLAVLMAVQVRSRRWTNIDASQREERPVIFIVAGAGLLGLTVWLAATEPASPVLRGVPGPAALLAVSALVNRWVKVSLHVGFAALSAASLVALGSPAGWALAVAVPAVAWSRLILARHTLGELAAGLILGVSASLLLVG